MITATRPVEPGRPSKYGYGPETCARVVDLMSDGLTHSACAGELNVSRETFYAWMRENPDFFDAVELGRAKRQAFWERLAINNAKTGEGSAALTIFALKNVNGNEWRDQPDPGPATNVNVLISDTEVAHRIAFLLLGSMPVG